MSSFLLAFDFISNSTFMIGTNPVHNLYGQLNIRYEAVSGAVLDWWNEDSTPFIPLLFGACVGLSFLLVGSRWMVDGGWWMEDPPWSSNRVTLTNVTTTPSVRCQLIALFRRRDNALSHHQRYGRCVAGQACHHDIRGLDERDCSVLLLGGWGQPV